MTIKVNDKIGSLLILSHIGYVTLWERKFKTFKCKCDCGNIVELSAYVIRTKKHCGHNDKRTLKNKTFKEKVELLQKNNISDLSKRNTSGYTGISWSTSNDKWRAYVDLNNKRYSVGSFDIVEEAYEAREKKKQELTRKNSNNLSKANISGYVGVSWVSSVNQWRAYLYFKRKHLVVGDFDSVEEAYEAREKKKQELLEYTDSDIDKNRYSDYVNKKRVKRNQKQLDEAYKKTKKGMLTPIERTNKKIGSRYVWIYKCDCGNIIKRTKSQIVNSISCGCYQKKVAAKKLSENSKKNLVVGTNIARQRSNNLSKVNTSGYPGVSWFSSANKWRAYLNFQYKQIYIGLFDSAEEAYQAREKKKQELLEYIENEIERENI